MSVIPGVRRGRVLEPEVMDEAGEVAAYLDGVATAHLDRLDDTFVRSSLAKIAGIRNPLAIDVGTGTGAIPVKMAIARPDLRIVGVDRSGTMLGEARGRARGAGVGGRVSFRAADGRRLPFRDGTFDLVVSNSLLHHIPDPAPVIAEMGRVLMRRGALFVRDLKRPRTARIEEHIRKHGRFYRGTMLRLFADSVRAAFTESELREIVRRAGGMGRHGGARVRRQFETYLVIVRP